MDELIGALRICNNPKGHRCSECPVFGRYEHRRCKSTVDRQAANALEVQQRETERLRKECGSDGTYAKLRDFWYEESERLRVQLTAAMDALNRIANAYDRDTPDSDIQPTYSNVYDIIEKWRGREAE